METRLNIGSHFHTTNTCVSKSKRMVVYVVGPITPTDPDRSPQVEFLQNIRRGVEACLKLISLGYAPICVFFDWLYWFVEDEDFLDLLLENVKDVSKALLAKSDVVLALSGWDRSSGAKEELRLAKKLKIPIFYDYDSLNKYRSQRKEKSNKKKGVLK